MPKKKNQAAVTSSNKNGEEKARPKKKIPVAASNKENDASHNEKRKGKKRKSKIKSTTQLSLNTHYNLEEKTLSAENARNAAKAEEENALTLVYKTPAEILLHITTFMAPWEIAKARAISRLFWNVYSDATFWRNMLTTHFPSIQLLEKDIKKTEVEKHNAKEMLEIGDEREKEKEKEKESEGNTLAPQDNQRINYLQAFIKAHNNHYSGFPIKNRNLLIQHFTLIKARLLARLKSFSLTFDLFSISDKTGKNFREYTIEKLYQAKNNKDSLLAKKYQALLDHWFNTTVLPFLETKHNKYKRGFLEACKFRQKIKVLDFYKRANYVNARFKQQTALHLAAWNGDSKTLKRLIRLGAMINVYNSKKRTPLFLACAAGHVAIVKFLLEKNAQLIPTVRDLFEISVSGHHSEIVKLVYDTAIKREKSKEACTEQKQEKKEEPDMKEVLQEKVTGDVRIFLDRIYPHLYQTLNNFVKMGDIEAVRIVLPYIHDINQPDSDICPALHVAVSSNQLLMVELLLKSGADVNQLDSEGNTVFHLAAQQKKIQVLKTLLTIAANVDGINLLNKFGETGLFLILKMADMRLIELIPSDKLQQADTNGDTMAHYAAEFPNHNKEFLKTFVEYLTMQRFSLEEKNNQGLTPLHCASMPSHRNIKLIHILLEKKVNIDIEDSQGQTPIFYTLGKIASLAKTKLSSKANKALYPQQIKILKLLLQRGANVNHRNHLGQTPFHILINSIKHTKVCDNQSTLEKLGELMADVVKILLAAGADPHICDEEKQSPFVIVSRAREIFLQSSTNVSQSENSQNNPITFFENSSWSPQLFNTSVSLKAQKYEKEKEKEKEKNNNHSIPIDNNILNLLYYAALTDDVEIVKGHLNFISQNNLQDNVMSACQKLLVVLAKKSYNGSPKTIALLKEYGVDINCRDDENHTPLFYAIKRGSIETILVLLANEAVIDEESMLKAKESSDKRMQEVLQEFTAPGVQVISSSSVGSNFYSFGQ